MWVGRRVDRLGAAEPPGDNRGNGSAERRSEPTVDHACGICAPIRSCRALHRDCRGEDSPRGRSVCQSLVIGRRLSRPLIAPDGDGPETAPAPRTSSLRRPRDPHAYDETSKPVRPRRSGSSLPCPSDIQTRTPSSPDQSQSALVGLDPAFYRCHAVGYAGAPRTRGQGERVRPNEGRSPAPRARRHIPPKCVLSGIERSAHPLSAAGARNAAVSA